MAVVAKARGVCHALARLGQAFNNRWLTAQGMLSPVTTLEPACSTETNRLVRTRMLGGVAGGPGAIQAPYADRLLHEKLILTFSYSGGA